MNTERLQPESHFIRAEKGTKVILNDAGQFEIVADDDPRLLDRGHATLAEPVDEHSDLSKVKVVIR